MVVPYTCFQGRELSVDEEKENTDVIDTKASAERRKGNIILTGNPENSFGEVSQGHGFKIPVG